MAKKRRPAKRAAGPRIDRTGSYRILVEMRPNEEFDDMGRRRLDYLCMPQPPETASGVRRVHAYASGSTVTALRKAGRKVKVLADARKEGKRLQKFISKTDRFAGGKNGPPGVGKLV